ncbi:MULTISPECIES: hypothetical protein [unclassified Paenibacillus]|uniref:hypothetical protein n=1 Tax=unclassified Paenibacillus TaxID=185978 RepID=UPI0009A8FA69|nr:MULTISPECIES: hypothetical protein [unclassified Paenibacillus]SLK16215.1 hypothetical protein SAMN06272722_110101 [Paenibacillus sp. RU5A]SOC74258.1 hypothetical protein SAMN05880581_110101 [Paenibacillus sp. RU26A]SOC76408.1 hypothetical protein SAMN05880586_110101 [Paenibacillus sp. RU5M]
MKKDNGLNIMVYTLNSGVKGTVELSKEQSEEWIKCYNNETRFITSVGKDIFGLNASLVADFKLEQNEQQIELYTPNSSQTEENSTETELDHETRNILETDNSLPIPRVTFKITCKCSATYHAPYRKTTTFSKCKYCGERVFVDYSAGIIDTHFGKGLFMTNKKFVNREFPRPEGYDDLVDTYVPRDQLNKLK